MMAIPEVIKYSVEKQLAAYCDNKIPLQARSQVKLSYSIQDNNVTLYEERVSYRDPKDWTKKPIAQFRYGDDNEWTLYSPDRNGRWHEYLDAVPSNDLQDLLGKVDDDPTGIFWG